jgi:arsenate reductase-like glutaredoxin family protein
LAAGKRIWITHQRKTATYKDRGKKTVSEAEHELVVRIPRVVGFRPIVVEPQAVLVAFQVEHVRVAIGVGLCDAPSMPPSI